MHEDGLVDDIYKKRRGTKWPRPLTGASGTKALIVWNVAGNSHYTPATEYVDCKMFNATYEGRHRIYITGTNNPIGVSPILFESVK